MLDEIKSRLESLGYKIVAGDDVAIVFGLNKVEQHIKHFCNISEIPDCLKYVTVDMVCGEFLQSKKAMGQLSSVQIDQIVKKIQDGDTTVEYATTTDPEAVFNSYLNKLTTGYTEDLIAHRKLKW